ncbi:MAG: hypothetical protein ACRDWW_05985 [Acidimicrobiales bacterium]
MALSGQLSCAEWLVWRAKMARATAYEKLHVAHQLARRPVVARAFAEGRLSYSAVRAICRIEGPEPAVDEALVVLAEAGTVADVERAVRAYQLHADQHHRPPDPHARRGLRTRCNYDGTATAEVTLTELEAEELMAVLQAFVDCPSGQSAAADSATDPATAAPAGSGPQSADADSASAGGPLAPESQRRADALMDMAAVALAHAGGSHTGADRYLVHLVVRPGEAPTLIDGSPLDAATTAAVGCDASGWRTWSATAASRWHSGEGPASGAPHSAGRSCSETAGAVASPAASAAAPTSTTSWPTPTAAPPTSPTGC